MDVELKPCPFCGGEAFKSLSHLPFGWVLSVECKKCEATVGPYSTPADAIAAWNARAPDAAVAAERAENERLREALEVVQFMACNHGGQLENDASGLVHGIHAVAIASLTGNASNA